MKIVNASIVVGSTFMVSYCFQLQDLDICAIQHTIWPESFLVSFR